MKKIVTFTMLGIMAVFAWATCDPPAGHPTSCRSLGVTPGSDGWNGSMFDDYSWTCCNQNYSCEVNNVNYGYRFTKTVGGYYKNGVTCYDYDNIVNSYPTNPVCCNPIPIEVDPHGPPGQ